MSYVNISPEDKSVLDRLRDRAKRHGMRIKKARGHQHCNQRGGVQLVREYDNRPLEGWDFDLDLKQAAYWISYYGQRG